MTTVNTDTGGIGAVNMALIAGSAGAFGGSGIATIAGAVKRSDIADARARLVAYSDVGPKYVDPAALPVDDEAARAVVQDAYAGRLAGITRDSQGVNRGVRTSTVNVPIGDITSVAHGPDDALRATRELASTSGRPGVSIRLGDRHFIGNLTRDLAAGWDYPNGIPSPNLPQIDSFTPSNRTIEAVVRAGDTAPTRLSGGTVLGKLQGGLRSAERYAASGNRLLGVGAALGAVGIATASALIINLNRPVS